MVAVNITNAGSGYTSAPTVTIAPPTSGTTATASASIELSGTLTINSLGDQNVDNYAYSGPSAGVAPYNQQKVKRHYGFGTQCTAATSTSTTCNTVSSVTIGGISAPIVSWTDTQIKVTVPSGVPACAVQQQAQYGGSNAQCGQMVITAGNGKQSVDAVSVTVGGKAPTRDDRRPDRFRAPSDAAAPGDLIIVPPGTFSEMLLMWKPVRLQGVGAASSIIDANPHPAGKLDPWRRQIVCLFGLSTDGHADHRIECLRFDEYVHLQP